MTRTGRPIKGSEARNEQLHIRITHSEAELLAEVSAMVGKSKTETIMMALELLKRQVSERDPG